LNLQKERYTTAGGTIVIGVKDKTKEAVGLNDVLKEQVWPGSKT
jgi:predicted HTH transcriptional regulator